jgi:hypothetical protein
MQVMGKTFADQASTNQHSGIVTQCDDCRANGHKTIKSSETAKHKSCRITVSMFRSSTLNERSDGVVLE